jgi:hypothetical protein
MSTETVKEYAKLEGNYTYVGFDIDTTGRRLIDEVRISAILFFGKIP